MAGTITRLGALIKIDETAAREKILEASRATNGSVRASAKALGVSECSLHRILGDLDLRLAFKRAGLGLT